MIPRFTPKGTPKGTLYVEAYMINQLETPETPGTQESLEDLQLSLETQGIQDGIQRFRKRLEESAFSETQGGLQFISSAIPKLSQYLQGHFLTVAPKTRKDAPQFTLSSLLRETFSLSHPDEVSLVLTKTVLDHAFRSLETEESTRERWGNYTRILKALSDALTQHHNFCLYKESPDWERTERHLKTRSRSQVHRERALSHAMSLSKLPFRSLSEDLRLLLGMAMLNAFVESTGLVYVTFLPHPRGKGPGLQHVRPHPDALRHILRLNSRLELLSPVNYPMVIPAVPWENSSSGAYLRNTGSPSGLSIRFIRSGKAQNAIAECSPGFPRVTRIADILGQSAFRINRGVLQILREAVATKSPLLQEIVAPDPQDLDLPGKPWSSQEEYDRLKRESPDVVKEWKRKAAKEYDRILGSEAVSLRAKVGRQLMMAHKMEEHPRIFFPHNVDFRGRYYPVSPYVNPQSDDTGVSLLEFATPSPITDSNLEWYLIHGANLWGKDKAPFSERVAFASSPEFQRDVLKISADPLGNAALWTSTDSPMMFLAWALEYAQVLKGTTSETHQIISVDGTCNGLQHYSALLRDPIGAATVNLTPGEKPADVYSDIAKRTIEILKARVDEDESAAYWIPLVSRKVVKRNVMTTPYGVTRFGMKDQLNVELKKIDGMPSDYKKHTLYLSCVIYEALGSCISSAQVGMDYLRYVAKTYLENELEVSWVTPLGLHAQQEYHRFNTSRLQLRQGSARINITRTEDTHQNDRRKNISAFSPNFIHSLDASHLGFTVEALHDQFGVRDFCMVHDSYGTSLSHVAQMNQVLREQFVRLYSEFDPLESLRTSFRERTGKDLDPVPAKGTFDITQVLKSQYFFM